MSEGAYDYDVLSMTFTSKHTSSQTSFSMIAMLAEYGPSGLSGQPDKYNLTFEITLDKDNKDVNFVILNDDGDNCIKVYQDVMSYTEEMIKKENAMYKNFLLESFADFF